MNGTLQVRNHAKCEALILFQTLNVHQNGVAVHHQVCDLNSVLELLGVHDLECCGCGSAERRCCGLCGSTEDGILVLFRVHRVEAFLSKCAVVLELIVIFSLLEF